MSSIHSTTGSNSGGTLHSVGPGAGHDDLLFRAREGDLYFGALRELRGAVTTTTRPMNE